jgi:hypothetical protein
MGSFPSVLPTHPLAPLENYEFEKKVCFIITRHISFFHILVNILWYHDFMAAKLSICGKDN